MITFARLGDDSSAAASDQRGGRNMPIIRHRHRAPSTAWTVVWPTATMAGRTIGRPTLPACNVASHAGTLAAALVGVDVQNEFGGRAVVATGLDIMAPSELIRSGGLARSPQA